MEAINWDLVTTDELEVIQKIVSRACSELNIDDKLSLQMDISATHICGNPLDLDKLLGFDSFNFTHDIYGIMNHIDRRNGKLRNCFIPRCSK